VGQLQYQAFRIWTSFRRGESLGGWICLAALREQGGESFNVVEVGMALVDHWTLSPMATLAEESA
jgi:hypothetical protein